MNCPKCGNPMGETDRFCSRCGAPAGGASTAAPPAAPQTPFPAAADLGAGMPAPPATPTAGFASSGVAAPAPDGLSPVPAEGAGAPRSGKKRRRIVAVVAAVAVLAAVAILLGVLLSPAQFGTIKTSIVGQTRTTSSIILVEEQMFEVEGMISETSASMTGEKVAALAVTGQLYDVDRTEARLVAEGVMDAVISANGKAILFLGADNVLNLYDCKSHRMQKVADNVQEKSLILSPNGKTALFQGADDGGLYLYQNGSTSRIGEDCVGLGVSDGGKYIYYVKNGADLYCLRDGEETALASEIDLMGVSFNRDLSEVVFIRKDVIYVSVKGGTRKELCQDGYLFFAMPNTTGAHLGLTSVTICYDVGTLRGLYAWGSDGDLYYIDDKWETTRIAGDIISVQPSANGRSVCYISGDTLYCGDQKDSRKIADGVESFAMTKDGSRIYYVTEGGELWSQKGNDEYLIANGVKEIGLTDKDVLLYLLPDGSSSLLYACDNGRDATQVASGVHRLEVRPGAVYYVSQFDQTAATGDYYYSDGDGEFRLVAEDVMA